MTPRPFQLAAMAACGDRFRHGARAVVLVSPTGSGTTGIAALRLGRRCILIEKDPKYAALCIERMTAEGAGSTLSAYRNGQLSILGDAPPATP